MRKMILLTFTLFMLFSVVSQAKSGDIAGVYYSTDIITSLNGEEIDSINIGGQTLISAEDMKYYGFSVNWLADIRELRINSLDHASNGIPPKVKKSVLPSGSVIGNYYETDIITYLDGKPISAFNIGGRTYIHAEETRNFGFDAVWDANERTLKIVSDKFAGYEYSFPISSGKEQTSEGCGNFSITYSKDSLIGSGDAEYFSTVFNAYGTHYEIFMQFGQNDGLFFSSKLRDALDTFSQNQENAISAITFSINGEKATDIKVHAVKGNGHYSFYIKATGIPKHKQEDIKEIVFSVGETIDEKFEMDITTPSDVLVKYYYRILKKYPLDWIEKYYETDEFIALHLRESSTLGEYVDRLYIVNKADNEISDDILDTLRKTEGFNFSKLKIFAMKVKAVKSNLFFSCVTDLKSGDFYVDMNTYTLHTIAVKEK